MFKMRETISVKKKDYSLKLSLDDLWNFKWFNHSLKGRHLTTYVVREEIQTYFFRLLLYFARGQTYFNFLINEKNII